MNKLKKLVGKNVVAAAAVTMLTATVTLAQSGGSGSSSSRTCGTSYNGKDHSWEIDTGKLCQWSHRTNSEDKTVFDGFGCTGYVNEDWDSSGDYYATLTSNCGQSVYSWVYN